MKFFIIFTFPIFCFILYKSLIPLSWEEISLIRERCENNNQILYINPDGLKAYCKDKPNPVLDCIREYTEWIEKKYNNPDTVSSLNEDDYSRVVETCKNNF